MTAGYSQTYSQIQTRVLSRIIDLPAAVQTEVPLLVNEALYELQSRHNFKVMEGELYAWTQYFNRVLQQGSPTPVEPYWGTWPQSTTIANLTMPTLFKEWNGDPWWVRWTDGTIRFMVVAGTRRDIYGTWTEGDWSFPNVVLVAPPTDINDTSNIQVYPLPDGLSDWPDGEYRLVLPYYGYVPQLVNNGDNNWFTNNSHGSRFLVEWATSKGFSLDWDTAHEQEHLALAEQEYKLCVDEDKKYRVSAVNELAIHARGQYSGRTRA